MTGDEYLVLLDEMIAKHERLALKSPPLQHPSACHNTITFLLTEARTAYLAYREKIVKALEAMDDYLDVGEATYHPAIDREDAIKIVRGE